MSQEWLAELNKEKQKIVETDGNLLVTANPGTGKTLLLTYKYAWLLKKGIKPENILCLTFTNKAKKELEERISKLLNKLELNIELTKLNIHTFHSYTLEHLEEDSIISSNLLRFAIYQFLKDNEILNYPDSYLLETIVPKMENLIRYLKNFGIKPENINLNEVNALLEADKKFDKSELEDFANHFVNIFKHYEKEKQGKGIDYTDLLLDFVELRKKPSYEYILVDELQDLNTIEADIAIQSAKHFVAVGDKKQAIFGFQGGSILNFTKFSDSKKFVLSENFRSSNEILKYASTDFISKTSEKSHKEELAKLTNKTKGKSRKPLIIESEKKETPAVIGELIKQIGTDKGNIAVIVRTNGQLMTISEQLTRLGVEHSTTYFSASRDAKKKITRFLQGLLSNDIQLVKNAMFTPFFPTSIQEAFELADKKVKNLNEFYKLCSKFKEMRNTITKTEDIIKLFHTLIIPVSISYGKEFLLGALNVENAIKEALNTLTEINNKNIIDYIESSDLLGDESGIEKQVILTTVHKAKGREYDNAIYVPQKTRDRSNFQDTIVEAILKSKGINAKEELEEESLRIDFVAFTRAKDMLYIVTEKTSDYTNEFAETKDIVIEGLENSSMHEKLKNAYALFVNGDLDKAKALLEDKDEWVVDFIKKHFETLDRLSFSKITNNAEDYLKNNILNIHELSPALELGTRVHALASELSLGHEVEVEDDLLPYKENIVKTLEQIKKEFPICVSTEEKVRVPLSDIMDTTSELAFKGYIDAVFKNSKEEYLIVDWKTDKDELRASKHRQQLETYKNVYAAFHKIKPEKIRVGIAFVGLKKRINDGKTRASLDYKQPVKRSFGTVTKKITNMLEWKEHPLTFFKDLAEKPSTDEITRAVLEQYEKEKEL